MRKTRIAAFAGALATAATLLTATPALAVDRTCYDGYFCVYKDANYSTANTMYRFNKTNNDWYTYASSIYRADSSWKNRYTRDAYVCDAGWITTNTIHLKPGASISYSSAANDRGAEHAWSNCS
ncbi:peptidase inhibitor family I36 protein [Krasilnikovia sp. M28-CT-15]|uniref:peptidase inhibitor family I36 protein n=1 Tax=Krasilnikovia sp. M28-CT-15 TaxID=3373540 RepID=UPI0038764C7E